MIRYQILMGLALPFALAQQALFGARGAVAERLGLGAAPAPGARLWLHAASVGEVRSARWVIEALLAARPGLQVLVTLNTATGRDLVRGWGLAGVTARLAPFDSAGAAARVLDRWQPQALIIVENELWPARVQAAYNRGVPVLVIGARLSARSARRWGWVGGLARRMLGMIDWLSAQDAQSLERFQSLGLPQDAAGPVVALKARAEAVVLPPPFAAPAPRAQTLLAASTHAGEDEGIIDAFRANTTFRHLILAPRHPRRGDEIAQMLTARGLAFARRSKGETPTPDTAVYLADTLGEMDHWYAMAGSTLIGGSFAPKGGHTPWEPAAHGSAILHGPSLHNFAGAFAALDRAGGAIALPGLERLAGALNGLDADKQTRLSQAAKAALRATDHGDAVVARLLQAIRS